MTRYARGKPTHQRVAKDPTPWDELKETPVKSKDSRKRKSEKSATIAEDPQPQPSKKLKKQKRKHQPLEASASASVEPEPLPSGSGENTATQNPEEAEATDKKKHRKNKNVKGFGESKLIKIFGQFWVPADDAKRLQKLVTSMKEKGLSRKEISNAVQNERRRAEKAGKRIRDKTCFNCRQYGHVLNDCPKIDGKDSGQESAGGGSGTEICFKCGSTEHSSRHCRKQEDKFDFAKCFICSETGHISRQCPKNKRGIYPSGGSCNQCGEFTHLAKDCTKFVMSSANSEPVAPRPSKIGESDIPSTGRIVNPYASTEYEDDTGKSNNFVLKGKFNQTSKNQKIRF